MKKQTCIIIGAGSRGQRYAGIMAVSPDKFQVVGIAEPIKSRNKSLKDMHNIPEDKCFESWEQILSLPKMADFAVIATQDGMHFEPAMKAIECGYHLLLEKPISPSPKQCKLLIEAAEKKGVKIVVCHVLRYTRLFKTMKELIVSGAIGELMSIEALEPVGIRHQSHSFVRGNWHNSIKSSPMILAKSCHDMDLMQWLVGKACKKVQSFGSLTYFTKDNKPEGAPARCIDGCPHADNCIFDTKRLYQGEDAEGGSWFKTASTKLQTPTEEDVEKVLKTSEYGKCVFDCDNDVVDHQVVNLLFDGGVTATFTMTAFTPDGRGREMRLFGTKGIIEIFGKNDYIYLTRFDSGTMRNLKREEIDVSLAANKNGVSIVSGHGGGDAGIIDALYDELNDNYQGLSIATGRESYVNHLIAFAAEKSRIENNVIDIVEFEKSL